MPWSDVECSRLVCINTEQNYYLHECHNRRSENDTNTDTLKNNQVPVDAIFKTKILNEKKTNLLRK